MATQDFAFLTAFGKVLRSHRHKAELSQEELAEASGLHRVYISELERGRKAGSLTALRAIALALGVPLSSLLAEAEKATTPRRR